MPALVGISLPSASEGQKPTAHPQLFPANHRAVCLPDGRALTHLHNSKARATGRVLSARLALLAGAVLPFLAGTNSV